MSDDDDDDYQVGYGKPPKHTQFPKGQSGNSKGRPKGARGFKTDLEDILSTKVKVTKDGRPAKVSSQLAMLMRLREKALKGEPRALDRLLTLAAEHSAEKEAQSAERTLSRADDEILARFLEDKLRASGPGAEQVDEGESDNGE
jgi:hypothetical protein